MYENRPKEASESRNGVILTPNQRVVFDKISRKLVTGLVENPVIIQSPAVPQPFLFEERPLPTVLKVLERAFGVEIVLENHALASCVFTADLTDLPLYTQLNLICKSVNAQYEQRGTVPSCQRRRMPLSLCQVTYIPKPYLVMSSSTRP